MTPRRVLGAVLLVSACGCGLVFCVGDDSVAVDAGGDGAPDSTLPDSSVDGGGDAGRVDSSADAGGSDANLSDAPVTTYARSCVTGDAGASDDGGAGLTNCGDGGESCCESIYVPGGVFQRGYDGMTYDAGWPATVSPFRLDRYEVTVGRFRQWYNALLAGDPTALPTPGSGKHAYLNGGKGLNQIAGDAGAGYEVGWSSTYPAPPTTAVGWTSGAGGFNSNCNFTFTGTPGPGDKLPINCLSWYNAYAFCIWDGGFLPSDAEWNFAASGGALQYAWPWGNAPSPTCAYANYNQCVGYVPDNVGTDSPTGDGFWGHADLAGNVAEFVLDGWIGSGVYPTPCTDCVQIFSSPVTVHNWSFNAGTPADVLVSARYPLAAVNQGLQDQFVGMRCGRPP